MRIVSTWYLGRGGYNLRATHLVCCVLGGKKSFSEAQVAESDSFNLNSKAWSKGSDPLEGSGSSEGFPFTKTSLQDWGDASPTKNATDHHSRMCLAPRIQTCWPGRPAGSPPSAHCRSYSHPGSRSEHMWFHKASRQPLLSTWLPFHVTRSSICHVCTIRCACVLQMPYFLRDAHPIWPSFFVEVSTTWDKLPTLGFPAAKIILLWLKELKLFKKDASVRA